MDNGAEHIDFDLLTKYLAGETTAAEKAAVDVWLASSADNRKVLDELKQVWDMTSTDVPEVEVDTDAAWAKMQQKISVAPKGKVVEMQPNSGFKLWRVAAIAVVLIGVVFAGVKLLQPSIDNGVAVVLIENNNELVTDTMPDGTVVNLNAGSFFTFPEALAEDERRVQLKGEAFFDVTPDATRPFVIEAGGAEVKVLGTSFNVKAINLSGEVEVVVATGKVQLSAGNNKVVLLPGEKGIYNKNKNSVTKLKNDDADVLFWLRKQLQFNNTTLIEVVDILNQRYDAKLVLEDEAAGSCRFTASFEDEPLPTILTVLTTTFGLQLEEGDDQQILKGSACNASGI